MNRREKTAPERLEPVNNGKVVNGDGSSYIEYVCPCCGNPVTRRMHKYNCGACKQNLAWPGVDYSGYDAEIAARFAEKSSGKSDGGGHV